MCQMLYYGLWLKVWVILPKISVIKINIILKLSFLLAHILLHAIVQHWCWHVISSTRASSIAQNLFHVKMKMIPHLAHRGVSRSCLTRKILKGDKRSWGHHLPYRIYRLDDNTHFRSFSQNVGNTRVRVVSSALSTLRKYVK